MDGTEFQPGTTPVGNLARRTWAVRALLVFLGLCAWFWSQNRIATRGAPSAGIGDGLHRLTAPWHAYLLDHLAATDALLIVSSAGVDLLALFLLLRGIFGESSRPMVGLILLIAIRQVCQILCALPIPPDMIWHNPGFPSLLVTYDIANDFFFSGHVAIAVLGALELARFKGVGWRILGVMIVVFEGAAVLTLRAHYTMDVFAGAITALWVASISSALAARCDRRLNRLIGSDLAPE